MHRKAVPRSGGLAVFAGLMASLVAPSLTKTEGCSLVGAALLLVDALDDRYHLGPAHASVRCWVENRPTHWSPKLTASSVLLSKDRRCVVTASERSALTP